MNRTIWKFHIPIGEEKVVMARGKALHVDWQEDSDHVQVWFEVFPEVEQRPRILKIFSTGGEIPEGWDHIGTCLTKGGAFVWHLYEKVSNAY